MTWNKRGSCMTFDDYVLERTGHTREQLSSTEKEKYLCPGIGQAADMIRNAVREKRYICVIADYDADGINSAAEMYCLLKRMGLNNQDFRIVVPKRFSDGYGINCGMLEGLPEGTLVITVDNGIAAVEPVRYAKEKGMQVLILDHHLSGEEKPDADLIVDPEDNSDGWTFHGYCGAGLVYKLAEFMYPKDKAFLDELSVFAMIATVGDCVDVTGDDRNIILRGLRNLNDGNLNDAMLAIADKLRCEDGIENFSEYEIGFKIAPMFNAPGRLKDNGGTFVVSGLFSKGDKARDFADQIYDINKYRKELVKKAEEEYEPTGDRIRFLYVPDFEEGLCGILAGHISERNGRIPAFVMTDSADGIVKGSARSGDCANVFEMMNTCGELFTKKGGHAQAAGFSLKKENVTKLKEALELAAPDVPEDVSFYDLTSDINGLSGIFESMEQIRIFGEGLERPVIRVRGKSSSARIIGQDKKHLQLKFGDVSCIGFSLAGKYLEMGMPNEFTMYGTLAANYWNGKKRMQFQILDIEE